MRFAVDRLAVWNWPLTGRTADGSPGEVLVPKSILRAVSSSQFWIGSRYALASRVRGYTQEVRLGLTGKKWIDTRIL